MTLPPAFSTAAIAALDAPATSIVDCGAKLALGQQADPVAKSPEQSRRDERRAIESAVGLQLTIIERCLQTPEIDYLEVLAKDLVVEAAFWKAAM